MPNASLASFAVLAVIAAPAFAQNDVDGRRQGARVAQPDVGPPLATMTCEHVAAPGRVRCEVEARVSPGHSISWGDIVLQSVPPFATALRGRVGPHDASVREPGLWRWPFALVAREKGAGNVEGQVRVVVCKDRACAAQDVAVVGRVEVGPQ